MTDFIARWFNRDMAIWFLFTIASLLATGLWTLYTAGVPSGGGSLLQPAYAVSAILIVTSLGLLRRQNWARALGVAISLWLLISSTAVFYPWPPRMSPWNLFRALPASFLFEPREVFTAVAVLFAVITIKLCYSVFLSEAFMKLPPPIWKVLIAIVIVGAALAADFGLPQASRRQLFVRPSAPALNAGKNSNSARKDLPAVSASKLVKFGEVITVKACRISLDETKLLLVTSDGQGHQVDLRTGKVVSYASQINAHDWPDSFDDSPIGVDADMYFDSNRNMILKFSDAKFKYGIGGGTNQFVSFTSAPNQIIVYNRGTAELKRLEIPVGTVVWNLPLPQEAKNKTARAFTSPDFVWSVLNLGDQSFLIHLREGRSVQTVATPRSPVQFGARYLRIPGEKESLLYSLPDVRRQDDPRTKTPGLAYFDPEAGVSVLEDGKIQFSTGDPLKLAAPPLAAAILNPPRQMVVLEDGLPQLRIINLETHENSPLGKDYDFVFNRANTCFTVSSTRNLFALSNGSEVEVFWSAFVGAGNFRSLVLKLPVK